MNANEIIQALMEAGYHMDDFNWGSYSKAPQVGASEVVERYGGEGQGETYYVVRYFRDHDVYLRADGVYTSYEGVEWGWEDVREVKPKQKTITVYE